MNVLITAGLSPDVKASVAEAVRKGGGRPDFHKDIATYAGEPDVIFGNVSVDFVLKQKSLRWLQTVSAGVDRFAEAADTLPSDLIVTNASGVYGPAGGDHVMAMVLYFSRGLYHYRRNQEKAKWEHNAAYARRLVGETMLVLGLGDLGKNVARRASGFGMQVIGVKRTPEAVEGVDRVITPAELDQVLPEAQHVAITMPLTATTKGLMSRERLQLLPRGAYLYNIGRGAIVDQDALIDALSSGHLAGAGLDVFVEEPLPADSPLWHMENVLITPHIGANTVLDTDHAGGVFIENWRRFTAGEPLENVVNLHLGY